MKEYLDVVAKASGFASADDESSQLAKKVKHDITNALLGINAQDKPNHAMLHGVTRDVKTLQLAITANQSTTRASELAVRQDMQNQIDSSQKDLISDGRAGERHQRTSW
ncbi:Uu.00g120650.m01.CDS01 [Anthostomella pinea]|uniref:Uu.00g120650.m01.CDS01 n=1 Tax=Anthostomella pinea TaxID=933095 RepID=A0AAI8VHD7_9PEZI|nr:Uu.00g120650.m01.CDS01 [Anthostomella pinea]